jgi:glutaminyl-tRNA synthetase
MTTTNSPPNSDFIRTAVSQDTYSGRFGGRVHTRFPPEPNGYLHIGHAKALTIDFGVAEDFGGLCNLRFDDTNPTKEDVEYVNSIREDIRWMGFDWGDREYYASDYFEQLYEYAVKLIKMGKAYVCDLSGEALSEFRGTVTEPGRPSPYRNRSVEENLDLLARMRAGEFPEGSRVLRAKIDMSHPNLLMRDPVMYRILFDRHHRTGDAWRIYPTYDFAHGQCDSIEGITHSLCSLEYEVHRPLYDWYLDALEIFHPRQIEFARLNLNYTVMSKRMLLQLVEGGYVTGWDDPRMPTLSGLRRRGYTPESIRAFLELVGVAKAQSVVDVGLLEHTLRQDLNRRAPRAFGVLRPVKLVLENYPEDLVEEMGCTNNPEDPAAGSRKVPFSRVLYVERDDFREDPPSKYWRLAPGREVRLRYAYFVTCVGVVKDETGEIVEIRCTYDPATRGGAAADGRAVRGTIHWVSAAHAVDAEVRLYDRLFVRENPLEDPDVDFLTLINPESLQVLRGCKLEPGLAGALAGSRYQLERNGYFCVDSDTKPGKLVLNRTVSLRDTWAKIERSAGDNSGRSLKSR